MTVDKEYDLAIVGSGIVGLGLAAAGVRRGLRVVIVERASGINGATVRNFGHIGTGVHTGLAAEYAARANEIWRELAAAAGFWVRESGTLIVAREPDELAVLEESGLGEIVSPERVADCAPVASALGGLVCEGDLQVDPRSAAPSIAAYLAGLGVEFRWRTSALGVQPGTLHTSRGEIAAQSIVVAVGHDVDELYPELAEQYGVVRCSLEMLLVDGVGLNIPLLTGTTLLRYSAFSSTPSALAVRARIAAERPELLEYDINEMYTERPDGTLFVGDTHTLSKTRPPFQSEAAFETLLALGHERFGRPLRVRERWQGIYASAPENFLLAEPDDGIRVVSVTTGIGMTTGFGLADRVVAGLFDS